MNTTKGYSFLSLPNFKPRASMIFGIIILTALMAFEVFNYSTTEFALHDLLGELRFAGLRWATILAIAFCGIDFAGIARLFTPSGGDDVRETWYLFGAWLLAATMNAMLTWWGVSMAIVNHTLESTAVVDADTVSRVIPVFVAIMVWLIRILIIGTISVAADHLMGSETSVSDRQHTDAPTRSSVPSPSANSGLPPRPSYTRAQSAQSRYNNSHGRPEPTYSSMSFDDRAPSNREGAGKPRSM